MPIVKLRTIVRPREAAVLALLWVALLGVLAVTDAFDRFASFAAAHEEWELDELVLALLLTASAMFVIAIRRAIDMRREIIRRETAEERAFELARHDPLTGLPNRRVLREELDRMIGALAGSGCELAVFVVDLDLFKPVNDIHGHPVGDALLVEVAARLRALDPGKLMVARLGGDEFVLAMRYPQGGDAPARLAARVTRAMATPFVIDGRRLEIGATVGIARCPTDGAVAEELLRAADVAMYDAKRAGRGIHRFFDAEMDERLLERSQLEAALRGAIETGEITAYFQPVLALKSRRIIGFEALARWQHPTRGTLPPEQFITLAEDLGLIGMLTDRILRDSCIAARDWPEGTTLAINISPLQLKDKWLAARLMAVLTETGFAPHRLIVEVTENAIIDDIDGAAEVFASLQHAGIRVALDDFGKGYSSLSHLRQLRFNHLKIDSSFVRSMGSVESQKIVSAVAGLGKALGMPVTAEGVETAAIADALRALGCDQAQGFLFGRPLPPAETLTMLRTIAAGAAS